MLQDRLLEDYQTLTDEDIEAALGERPGVIAT
jgi:uncharacterized protein (DUF433 family)